MAKFQTLNTPDPMINRIQDNVASAFNSLTGPFIGGQLITSVAVAATPTVINHGLNRTPQIWVICDQDTTTTVKRTAWNTNSITLQAGAACTLSIWVN